MDLRLLGSLGLSCFLLACGSSRDPELYLGPVGAASVSVPPPLTPGDSPVCPAPAVPELALSPSVCPDDLPAARPLGFSSSGASLVLASGGQASLHEFLPSGCPALVPLSSTPSPSLSGPVALAGHLWIATPSTVEVWADGSKNTSCALPGVRALAAQGAEAWALVGGRVRRLLLSGAGCEVGEPWGLSGVPVALGTSEGGGVWLAEVLVGGCSSPVVSRYTGDGVLDEGAPTLEAWRLGLCAVQGLAEAGGVLSLVDATCGRVAEADALSGQPRGRWVATAGETLVGVVPSAGGVAWATWVEGAGAGRLRWFHEAR